MRDNLRLSSNELGAIGPKSFKKISQTEICGNCYSVSQMHSYWQQFKYVLSAVLCLIAINYIIKYCTFYILTTHITNITTTKTAVQTCSCVEVCFYCEMMVTQLTLTCLDFPSSQALTTSEHDALLLQMQLSWWQGSLTFGYGLTGPPPGSNFSQA